MPSPIRQQYEDSRLDFWIQRLGRGKRLPEALKARLSPQNPLPNWALEAVPKGTRKIRILDIRSGAIPALGTFSEEVEVKLTAIDELAPEFDKLLDACGIDPPVRAQACAVEDILAHFGEGSFDIIYCYNGFNYTEDPISIYRLLLKCLRPKGRIFTFHDLSEDEDRFMREPDRFFHCDQNAEICIRQKGNLRTLADHLQWANIDYDMENGLLRLEMSRRCQPRPPRPVHPLRPSDKGDPPLPSMVSMHIPKTGGSSFQQFLQSLYGNGLRCLHSASDTNPDSISCMNLSSHIRCIHGHFQADAFDAHLPDALKVAWFRDPVERVVSSYHQFRRTPQSAGDSDFNQRFFSENWSLMQFAASPEMLNHVAWHLNAVPLDQFFFIGVTERFSESLSLFCHLIGRPAPDKSLKQNINPEKPVGSDYEISPELRQELISLYAEEYELYRYIQYRLDEQLKIL